MAGSGRNRSSRDRPSRGTQPAIPGGVSDHGGQDGTVRTVLIEQAARLMGVSRRTVYYRIREGRLETITTRCGTRRIVVRSFEALVREGRRKNAAARRRLDAAI